MSPGKYAQICEGLEMQSCDCLTHRDVIGSKSHAPLRSPCSRLSQRWIAWFVHKCQLSRKTFTRKVLNAILHHFQIKSNKCSSIFVCLIWRKHLGFHFKDLISPVVAEVLDQRQLYRRETISIGKYIECWVEENNYHSRQRFDNGTGELSWGHGDDGYDGGNHEEYGRWRDPPGQGDDGGDHGWWGSSN